MTTIPFMSSQTQQKPSSVRMTPTLLMSEASALTLWETVPPSLEIQPDTGRPRLSLALADDAQTRLANEIVTRHHYLRSPVDGRCSLLAYLVILGGKPVGCLIFGRPEASRVGGWYGDVAEKTAGKCRLSRWEVLNLSRVWIDPIAQEGGPWYSPEILPGFSDRHGAFHSTLATTVIEMALETVVLDYLVSFPPVDTAEPYQIAEILSYCARQHKGTIYQESGFRLERQNSRGLRTYARPVRPLTPGEDAYIRFLAEHSPRSKHYRALRATTFEQLSLIWEEEQAHFHLQAERNHL
jgi:hypothetical protein